MKKKTKAWAVIDKNKREIEENLKVLFDEAEKLGYTVYIAGDEEGNYFNRVFGIYENTKDKAIAIGVAGRIDEDNLFNP